MSKAAYRVIKHCRALLFDAIYERINDFVNQNGRQVNSHAFRNKNCVRVSINGDWIDGYCVRVMPKYVYYVRSENIFERHPDIKRVKSEYGVASVRPNIGNVVEVVQNWCVESLQG